jgi:hypothetical protein
MSNITNILTITSGLCYVKIMLPFNKCYSYSIILALTGHGWSHSGPCQPGEQVQDPSAGLHKATLAHWHVALQPRPQVSLEQAMEQYRPRQPGERQRGTFCKGIIHVCVCLPVYLSKCLSVKRSSYFGTKHRSASDTYGWIGTVSRRFKVTA